MQCLSWDNVSIHVPIWDCLLLGTNYTQVGWCMPNNLFSITLTEDREVFAIKYKILVAK